jgi:hypothetical protein
MTEIGFRHKKPADPTYQPTSVSSVRPNADSLKFLFPQRTKKYIMAILETDYDELYKYNKGIDIHI